MCNQVGQHFLDRGVVHASLLFPALVSVEQERIGLLEAIELATQNTAVEVAVSV